MNDRDKYLWVSASPSFKQFHRRLLNSLAQDVELEFWEYYQILDEGSSLDKGVELLSQYLVEDNDRSLHLIGHGIGGVIALEYARRYPQRVNSLVLLGVGVQPAIVWQSYYYSQLRLLPYDRLCILRKIATELFPSICVSHIPDLVVRLERDLVEAPIDHSLFHTHLLPERGVKMPLLVCNSQDDPVINEASIGGWKHYLKPVDRSWTVPEGGHFFHHFYPELVSQQIQSFWQHLETNLVSNYLMSVELN